MAEEYSRHLNFDSVLNFRDLGGYRTAGGYEVAWRRIFRSGELQHLKDSDLARLRDEIGLTTVVNLRSPKELKTGELDLLKQAGVQHHVSVPFIGATYDEKAEKELIKNSSHMGSIYLHIIEQEGFGEKLTEALNIISEPDKHPLVFHCAVGKDRTGILSAILLDILGVPDEDIIEDYTLTARYMERFLERMKQEPRTAKFLDELPGYFWEATPESMSCFLSTLREKHGSVEEYARSQGATDSIIDGLKRTLLT